MARSAGVSNPSDATVRILAALLPAGAGLLGAAVPTSRFARAAVNGVAAIALLAGGGIALLGARRSREAAAAPQARPPEARPVTPEGAADEARPSAPVPLTILVPARNEAAVIGALLADLGQQCGAPPEIVVIDDGSVDGTGEAARAALIAGAIDGRVIRRPAGGDGKGRALAEATSDPRPDRRWGRQGIVVVLDADARVAPGFSEACRTAIARGSRAATARRRMLKPSRGGRAAMALALLQDDEQALDDAVQRARLAFGGAAEFRGNGMVLRADTLAGIGGFPIDALCEDLELSTCLFLATGRGVDRPDGLTVWEQPVTGFIALLRQRLRWAEGSVRRDLRIVLPAMRARHIAPRRKLEPVAYAGQALVPWLAAGLALRALAGRSAIAARALATLLAAYGVATWLIAWSAVPSRSASWVADRVIRSAGMSLFAGLWLVVLPAAWLRVAAQRAAPGFAQTVHAPSAAFSEPEPDLSRRT